MPTAHQDAQHSWDGLWDRAISLANGARVPESVRQTMRFLYDRDVWFLLSRNAKAEGCEDAAEKRDRLGHIGIPLWDELKSLCFRYTTTGGRDRYVLAHCRGDREINEERLRKALRAKTEPRFLAQGELRKLLGLKHGLINPFETWRLHFDQTFMQVFDDELLAEIGYPGSVMTNAGDPTWGVEFYVKELVERSDHAVVEDIYKLKLPKSRTKIPDSSLGQNRAEREQKLWGVRGRQKIGIITGNAPEAGIQLWQGINEKVREKLGSYYCGDVSMPTVEVQSLPVLGLTMELNDRETEVWAHLRNAVHEMCKREVNFLSVACHTTHFFTPRIRTICESFDVEFVSMAEEVVTWLQRRGKTKFALASIGFVAGLDGGYSAYSFLKDEKFLARNPGIEVETPTPAIQEKLKKLSYLNKLKPPNSRAKKKQKGTNPNTEFYNILKSIESKTVVLGLTELSSFVDTEEVVGAKTGKTLIDPLRIYAESLACRYIGLDFPSTIDLRHDDLNSDLDAQAEIQGEGEEVDQPPTARRPR